MTNRPHDGLAVQVDEPLARHTAGRTGGACDAFVVIHRRDALATVVSECRSAGWRTRVLGAGTRVVVRDVDVAGAVLRLGTAFAGLELLGGTRWRVGGAVPAPALVQAAAAAGHAGLEFLFTTPGSVGASLALDPGWAPLVERVDYLHRGRIRDGTYDESRGRTRILCGVTIQLEVSTPARVQRALERALQQGRPVFPGAWYEHPRRGSVRDILAAAQLPLVRLRRVAIPDGAPELIVNLGGGTADDMELLHRSAMERVKQVHGVELSSRALWIGRKSAKS